MKKNIYTSLPFASPFVGVCALLFFSLLGTTLQAQVQEQFGGDLQVSNVRPISAAQRSAPEASFVVDPLAVYSNITTFSGSGTSNGGSALAAGNTISRLIADDLTFVGTPPFSIVTIRFNIGNLNTVAVSARPRIRFYLADGTAGAPGTLITGFTFNPISFTAGNVATYTGNVTAFSITSNNIWAGVTFDDNTGATGATLAQLDNLGMGIFNPSDVGTSTDAIFRTTSSGSFLANNPVGANINFSGTPLANLGWEFVTAPPIPVELMRFTARPMEQTALLEWATASEINNKGFQIERQGVNSGWEILGFVNGEGKGATYTFTDKGPLSIGYYRLRQIDNNGKEVLSKVVSVSLKDKNKLSIYPNPVATILTIATEASGDFDILNLLGQTVLHGKATQRIDVSSLPNGTYFLKIGDDQTTFTKQ
jgi:hypothetical protein